MSLLEVVDIFREGRSRHCLPSTFSDEVLLRLAVNFRVAERALKSNGLVDEAATESIAVAYLLVTQVVRDHLEIPTSPAGESPSTLANAAFYFQLVLEGEIVRRISGINVDGVEAALVAQLLSLEWGIKPQSPSKFGDRSNRDQSIKSGNSMASDGRA